MQPIGCLSNCVLNATDRSRYSVCACSSFVKLLDTVSWRIRTGSMQRAWGLWRSFMVHAMVGMHQAMVEKLWGRNQSQAISTTHTHTPISNTAITVRLSHTAPHQLPIIYCFGAGVCCCHHAASLVGSPASILTSIYSDASCAIRQPR